ncbi:MAG: glycosyltransferase family 39 protein [Planctomycetia bacterium]|nr:glycosyltransferase family 39 protein [Planctomycetia bacterium]
MFSNSSASILASPCTEVCFSSRKFWFLLLVFGTLLTFVPFFSQPTYRIDVLHQVGIGREYVAGTYIFPAFSTWILNGVSILTGHAHITPYLTAALLSILSIYGTARLGMEFLSPTVARLGAFSLVAYWYFNVGAAMYNNNAAMTFFWIYAIWMFILALRKNLWRYWFLTGLFLGLSLISKYTGIIIILTILIYMFQNANARQYWKSFGPYISIFTTILVFLPNFLFLIQHSEEIFGYIGSKRETETFLNFFLLLFSGWMKQLLIISPLLLIYYLVCKPLQLETEKKQPHYKNFLPFMLFCPCLIQIILQILTGVAFSQNSYGFQLWAIMGITVFYVFHISITKKKILLVLSLTIFLACVEMISLPISCFFSSYFLAKPSIRFFPAQELARQVDILWSNQYPHIPCPTVSGEGSYPWHAGVFSKFRPTINDPNIGPWCSDEIVLKKGGVVLWNAAKSGATVPKHVQKRFPSIQNVKFLHLTSLYSSSFKIPVLRDVLRAVVRKLQRRTEREISTRSIIKKNKDVPQERIGIGIIPPKL